MLDGMHVLFECLAIFFMSLVHEDLAIIGAGALILEYDLTPIKALITLYCGVVTGDFIVYGLGSAVRRLPWAQRLLIKTPVENARGWLRENLVISIAACRVLPGVLFPTYLACGWFKMPFKTFAATTMTTAVLYVPIALGVAVGLRQTVFQVFGFWGWVMMFGLIVLIGVLGFRKPKWVTMGKLVSAGDRAMHHHAGHGAPPPLITHKGMPSVDKLPRWVAAAERIPPSLFYIPFGLYWAYLGFKFRGLTLPTVANPNIEVGGMWGESKSDCMKQVGADQVGWLAPYVTIKRDSNPVEDVKRALGLMRDAGLEFPIVAKPDIGWQGYGVQLIRGSSELGDYLSKYPREGLLILQRYVPHDGEAGILYCRMPGDEKGRILSMTLRYFPFVVGDGETNLRDLIIEDPRNRFKGTYHFGSDPLHTGIGAQDLDRVPAKGEVARLAFIGSIRVGGLYRDASAAITPELTDRIDAVARSMPEFHFGRFDVRFESLDLLRKGQGFAIIEINGVGAEAIQIWDPEMSLGESYRNLFKAHRLTFEIGAKNRDRGFKPTSLRELIGYSRKQHKLIVQYPPSV